ncbi:MAG: L,D-transpeptidase [Rubellimicrobium sp.]|jgi:lipoprotein-anchoring transpeptidase ErfK/SrfK|nr:L,D-transpeptidase [Rubellimicrobium sp.]
MLTRRHFIATSAAAIAGGPALAQSAGPLQLDVTPEMLSEPLRLPPDFEGDFEIPARFRARIVPVQPGLPLYSIHIIPESFHLYFILPFDRAIRYGVAVGQEGLGWRGSAVIARKAQWPGWRPTDSMIERNPALERYADGMPGGPNNPLGARALYFYQNNRDTAIRVHGTTEPASIGRQASNGCFRMYNSHVIDLYERTPVGALAFAY